MIGLQPKEEIIKNNLARAFVKYDRRREVWRIYNRKKPFGGIEQNITLKYRNGSIVMVPDTSMVYPHPIIYGFNNKDPNINVTRYPELEKYKMFADTLGAPPFNSIVNIPVYRVVI